MKAKIINFTKQTIENITQPYAGRDLYKADDEKYLFLEVFTSGRKTFIYIRKFQGKVKFISIGTFPDISIQLAKKEAEKYSGMISQGIDPSIQKKKAITEQLTFEHLFNKYLEEHLKIHTKSWEKEERKFDRCIPERWKIISAKDITRDDVKDLKVKLSNLNGPIMANRVIAMIRSIFNYCIKEGLDLVNPAEKITMFPEKSRERFLDNSELQRFFEALEKEPLQLWKDFFMIALFTGARRSNIQSMRWEEIDFSRATWTVSEEKSKNNEALTIILPPSVIEILQRRKSESISNNPHVFQSPRKSSTGHVVEPKSAWRRILLESKLSDVRIHDLRRTLGSWQAAAGTSLQIIGKSLGHRNNASTQVYARLNLDPVRSSVNSAVDAMIASSKETKKKQS